MFIFIKIKESWEIRKYLQSYAVLLTTPSYFKTGALIETCKRTTYEGY